jgi:2-polyprenyl-3-methyl-5-hydroxy-6-metoxy-1,4-benzoquinol methylase
MRANSRRKRNVRETFEKGIKEHVRNQTVIDIGCVAHDESKRHVDGYWMHDMVVEAADEVLGVDILEDSLERLAEQGYDVEYSDAQDLDVDETFDIILLGELIEHLTDFDGLLQSIDEHLRPDGKFIVTTPNAMAVHWTALRLLDIEFVNSEHTCWFDVQTLSQLLARYGFEVTEVEYVGDCRITHDDLLQNVGWVCEQLLPDRVGKSTLVVVAKKTEDGAAKIDD